MTNTQTPPPATNVVNPIGAPVTNTVANHAKRQEKFNGHNFKKWQQEMFFYLITLGLARFLKETVPRVEPPTEDHFYNVYCKTTTAKELWESLERKYKTEDVGTKKFVVACFLDYKMVDSKNETSQVQDLQHKRKEMSVEDLVVRIRIKEDNSLAQKDTYTPDSAKADMIEHVGSSSRSNPKGKGKDKMKNDKKSKEKSEYLAPKDGIVKQKFQGLATIVTSLVTVLLIARCRSGAVDNEQKLYMGNYATSNIKGEGDVVLKMTSEKELKLTNVFKDEAIDKFILYKTKVKNQLGKKIKVVRSDKEGEYESPFTELCAKHGIRHEFTTPYSPQQNGIAERKNRTLKEMVTAMLISFGMSHDMWRMILVIAALRNLKVHQMDVKTAFLNGDLEEEIHMNQPEGFIAPGQEGKIIQTHNGLVFSQAHYVDKILNTHNAEDYGLARTLIDTSLHLSKNRGVGVAQLEYSRIIGMLMYLMTSTRPDLAYVVSRLSRYTSNPSNAHWKAITRVLHYLRYSRDYGLHYDRHHAVIEGYNDANWISNIKDSRSTSGYVFTLGGAAISWKSSKQTVIAKSTMELEFITLDKYGEEAEWLRQFVEDIPRWPKPVTTISIHCDSQSAIGRAQSTMYNGKSRHIRRRRNSIRQLLLTGVISIDYVASKVTSRIRLRKA
nr:zinc finger, CCHC-type [Tanacetum cinerariifolium]